MWQQVKALVLSLQWLRSLLGQGFNPYPWPGNFHMPWAQEKKKKKEVLNIVLGKMLPQGEQNYSRPRSVLFLPNKV